jgi:hypothetical protein
MTTKTIRFWAIGALVTMVTGLSACLKDNNTTPSRPRAAFSVLNGVLLTTGMDFYDNGTKLNNNSTIQMGFVNYGYTALGGVHTFAFNKVGQTDNFISVIRNYDSLTYYTLVAYGDSSNPQMASIKDDFTGSTTTAINFRFLHLSPTTAAVDFYIDNIKVDSNLTYVGNSGFYSTFKQLTKSVFSSNLKVKLAGTETVLAETTSPNVNLAVGNVYTFYLMGAAEFTDGKKLMVNNIYSYY